MKNYFKYYFMWSVIYSRFKWLINREEVYTFCKHYFKIDCHKGYGYK